MDEELQDEETVNEEGLNQRRMKFINHYIETGRAQESAQKAGYAESSAHVTASRLLKNDKIRAEIARINADLTEHAKYRKESILAEAWRIAKADIREAYDEEGRLKSIADMPENIARAIKSVETEELFDGYGEDRHQIGYTKKLVLYDKLKGIEIVGKANGVFVEKVEMTVNDSHAEKLRRARERAKKAREDESTREG